MVNKISEKSEELDEQKYHLLKIYYENNKSFYWEFPFDNENFNNRAMDYIFDELKNCENETQYLKMRLQYSDEYVHLVNKLEKECYEKLRNRTNQKVKAFWKKILSILLPFNSNK